MSKFISYCFCINCKEQTTTQSLKAHYAKCTTEPKNICEYCGVKTNNARFCSHTCSATSNNLKRGKKLRKKISVKETRKDIKTREFLSGEIKFRKTLRKYIAEARGYKCEICSISDWNGKPLTLIVDHINGDASNNNPSNLRLLCPNCNSQTDTFCGRNLGNGRQSRGLPKN